MEEPKSLHYYLEDLSRLEEISLGALEQWSKRLPYVQNIRLLIAKKNQQLGQVQNLDPFHVAATYSIDRTRLYEVLREKATVNKKIQLASLHDASILENTGLLEEMVQNTNHQSVEEPEIGINGASENVNIDIDKEDAIIQKPDGPAPQENLSTQEVIEEEKANIAVETTAMDIISPVIEENIKELEDINTEDPITTLATHETEETQAVAIIEEKSIQGHHRKINHPKSKGPKKHSKKKKKRSKTQIKTNKESETSNKKDKQSKKDKENNSKTKKSKKLKQKEIAPSIQNEIYVNNESSAYTQWLMSLRMANSGDIPYIDWTKNSNQKLKKKSKKKVKKKDAKIRALAKRSIEQREEIISEVLADLLLKQGHFKKAKKMYKQLSLIFPEKSSLFAAKINQIQKNK